MADVLSALPALLIFGVLMGAVFLFATRRQQHTQQQIVQAAQQHGFTPTTTDAELRQADQQLAPFTLFTQGARVQVRADGRFQGTEAWLLAFERSRSGMDANTIDSYLGVYVRRSFPTLPDFALLQNESRLETKLNAAIFGAPPEISLRAYPTLAATAQLRGSDPQRVSAWVAQGLTNTLEQYAAQGRMYSVQVVNAHLLIYCHATSAPITPQFGALLADAATIVAQCR